MTAAASLVQYGSDSDDSGSEQQPGSKNPPASASASASLSVMPRTVSSLKRPSSSLSLPPPAAKKPKIDLDPFGLGSATAAASSSSSSVKAKAKGKDDVEEGSGGSSSGGISGILGMPRTVRRTIDSRPPGASVSSLPPSTSAESIPSSSIHTTGSNSKPGLDDAGAQAGEEDAEEEGIPFGWAQDPDGTLYPVTPQAHEQYAQWQAAQQRVAQADQKDKDSSNSNSKLPSYSASDLAQSGKPSTSDKSLDAKYAAAAASASESDAPVVKNKATSGRARYKGQLSALLAIANERKEELEEKHSKGRDRNRDARQRYGF
ncbi:hypothetical protein CF319_g2649 [Tilletia indica]|nr:hypothetical protein CF319_g2649 [Tilletia indica]